MKRIYVITVAVFAVLVLAGCWSQQADVSTTTSAAPATDTVAAAPATAASQSAPTTSGDNKYTQEQLDAMHGDSPDYVDHDPSTSASSEATQPEEPAPVVITGPTASSPTKWETPGTATLINMYTAHESLRRVYGGDELVDDPGEQSSADWVADADQKLYLYIAKGVYSADQLAAISTMITWGKPLADEVEKYQLPINAEGIIKSSGNTAVTKAAIDQYWAQFKAGFDAYKAVTPMGR